MSISGAGGTNGGIGRFFMGLVMMVAGGYLFLNSIKVTNHFNLGYGLFSLGSMKVTSGMTLVPLIFGVGLIFYNSRNILGWALSVSSLIMISFGIISNIQFRLSSMTAYELITILVLMVGGTGLFLSSLKDVS